MLDKNEPNLFDLDGFARKIRVKLAELDADNKVVASQIGVSESVLSRVSHGKNSPNIETYLRIQQWLDSEAR